MRLSNLVRWPFLLALLLLIANDHWLKSAYPSWLTGKLSDFSGLFVFSVFLASLLPRRLHTDHRLLVMHCGIAVLFTIWKLAPIEPMLQVISSIPGVPVFSRVKDPTDLIALSVLPASLAFLKRSGAGTFSQPGIRSLLQRGAAGVSLVIAGWAIIATSIASIPHNIDPELRLVSSLPPAEVVYRLESIMNERGFEVLERRVIDDTTYRFDFQWETDEAVTGKPSKKPLLVPSSSAQSFSGFLTLTHHPGSSDWRVDATVVGRGVSYDERILSEAVESQLYDRIREEFSE